MTILNFIDNHTGLIVGTIFLIVTVLLYLHGEAKGMFAFFYDTLSEFDPRANRLVPSTKRMALISTVYALDWAFVKLTLAVCRWIDKGNDPTYLYIFVLVTLAGVGTGTYVAGKWIAGKFGGSSDPAAPLEVKE
ncbi:MAG: hypothetical protein JSS77_16025 [Acidobacteria bacterium]|nr:hypothetical protein [Acidobacteriota bacterium]